MDLRDDIIERTWNSGKERCALETKNNYDEPLRKTGISHLDGTRIRIMLCVSFNNLIADKQRICHTTYPRRKIKRDIAQT